MLAMGVAESFADDFSDHELSAFTVGDVVIDEMAQKLLSSVAKTRQMLDRAVA